MEEPPDKVGSALVLDIEGEKKIDRQLFWRDGQIIGFEGRRASLLDSGVVALSVRMEV